MMRTSPSGRGRRHLRNAGARLRAFVTFALAAILLVSSGGCGGGKNSAPDEDAPLNILFISSDTLRADRTGSAGHLPPTSPWIDRLAREGVQFANAFAPRSQTWPSLTSVMTSKYPVIHGVRTNGLMLDPKHESLPQYLQYEGYATAAFIGNMSKASHLGYDEPIWSNETKRAPQHERDNEIADKSIEWLRTKRPADRPFFLWVHFLNPHGPYSPPAEYRARVYDGPDGRFDSSRPTLEKIALEQIELTETDLRSMQADYDGDVVAADICVGRVLTALEQQGLADNTLVVFFSDHGDELYERNYYFMHSCSIYDTVLRVPMSMRLPGQIPPGTLTDEVVELIDIVPTACSLAGIEIPDWAQGQDLTSVIAGEPSRGRAVSEWHPPMSPTPKALALFNDTSTEEFKRLAREYGFDEMQKGEMVNGLGMRFEEGREPIYVLRTKDFRFVLNEGEETPNDGVFNWHPGKGFRVAREEYYDHHIDPGERFNRVDDASEVVAEAREWLASWRTTMEANADLASLPTDPKTIKALQDLGYLPGGSEDDSDDEGSTSDDDSSSESSR